MALVALSNEIIECNQCERLRNWAISRQGLNPDYVSCQYWARPVSGFGDEKARLVMVGLAPGAHGANRTGRPFTGDFAGDYLFRALYQFGYSNIAISESQNDGLVLRDAYITNAVRCVPPDDKPTSEEMRRCRRYLRRELKLLNNTKVILTLGEKGFNQVKAILKDLGADTDDFDFKHGKIKNLGSGFPTVVVSYHTSKRNFCTNKMSVAKLDAIFVEIEKILTGSVC